MMRWTDFNKWDDDSGKLEEADEQLAREDLQYAAETDRTQVWLDARK